MKKLKLISFTIISGIIILLSTTSFAKNGLVQAPSGLILREQGAFSGKVITTIKDKSAIEVLEKSGDWYKVKYNTYEGYVYAKYVKVEEEPEQISGEVVPQNSETINIVTDIKIYIIPSITSQIIGSVNKDSKITINYELGNWVNISCENISGWTRKYAVSDKIVKPEENTNANQGNPEQPPITEEIPQQQENKKGYVNVITSAIIRAEATKSSAVLGTLLKNAEVQIIGEEGDFYKIQYKKITGYMAKSLISETPVQ